VSSGARSHLGVMYVDEAERARFPHFTFFNEPATTSCLHSQKIARVLHLFDSETSLNFTAVLRNQSVALVSLNLSTFTIRIVKTLSAVQPGSQPLAGFTFKHRVASEYTFHHITRVYFMQQNGDIYFTEVNGTSLETTAAVRSDLQAGKESKELLSCTAKFPEVHFAGIRSQPGVLLLLEVFEDQRREQIVDLARELGMVLEENQLDSLEYLHATHFAWEPMKAAVYFTQLLVGGYRQRGETRFFRMFECVYLAGKFGSCLLINSKDLEGTMDFLTANVSTRGGQRPDNFVSIQLKFTIREADGSYRSGFEYFNYTMQVDSTSNRFSRIDPFVSKFNSLYESRYFPVEPWIHRPQRGPDGLIFHFSQSEAVPTLKLVELVRQDSLVSWPSVYYHSSKVKGGVASHSQDSFILLRDDGCIDIIKGNAQLLAAVDTAGMKNDTKAYFRYFFTERDLFVEDYMDFRVYFKLEKLGYQSAVRSLERFNKFVTSIDNNLIQGPYRSIDFSFGPSGKQPDRTLRVTSRHMMATKTRLLHLETATAYHSCSSVYSTVVAVYCSDKAQIASKAGRLVSFKFIFSRLVFLVESEAGLGFWLQVYDFDTRQLFAFQVPLPVGSFDPGFIIETDHLFYIFGRVPADGNGTDSISYQVFDLKEGKQAGQGELDQDSGWKLVIPSQPSNQHFWLHDESHIVRYNCTIRKIGALATPKLLFAGKQRLSGSFNSPIKSACLLTYTDYEESTQVLSTDGKYLYFHKLINPVYPLIGMKLLDATIDELHCVSQEFVLARSRNLLFTVGTDFEINLNRYQYFNVFETNSSQITEIFEDSNEIYVTTDKRAQFFVLALRKTVFVSKEPHNQLLLQNASIEVEKASTDMDEYQKLEVKGLPKLHDTKTFDTELNITEYNKGHFFEFATPKPNEKLTIVNRFTYSGDFYLSDNKDHIVVDMMFFNSWAAFLVKDKSSKATLLSS